MLLLSDNRIGILMTRGTPRGASIHRLSYDALFTDYGMILPCSKVGGEAANYLSGMQIEGEAITIPDAALIIDHEANLFLYGRHNSIINFRRILYGVGTREAFTLESSQDQALMMALELSGGDIEKAFDLYRKAFNSRNELIVINIPEVAERLKKEGKTKPFQHIKPLRKTA